MTTARAARLNLVLLLLQQVANFIPPLLVLPILGRALQVTDFARLGLLLAVGQLVSLLTEYSLNQQALWRLGQLPVEQRSQRAVASQWLYQILRLRGVLWLLTLAPALLWLHFFQQASDLELIAVALFTFSMVPLADFLFLGQEKLLALTLWNLIARWSLLPLTAILLHWQASAAMAVIAMGACYLLGNLGSLILARYRQLWHESDWLKPVARPALSNLLREGWHYFLSQASYHAYIVSVPLLANLTLTPTVAGLLIAADRLKNAAGYLSFAVTGLLGSRMAKASDPDTYRRQWRASLRWHLLLGISSSLGMLVLADWLVHLLYGPHFQAVGDVLRWLSPLPTLMALVSVLLRQRVTLERSPAVARRITLQGVAAFFLMFYPFSVLFGWRGSVVTLWLTETILLLLAFWALRRARPFPSLPAAGA